MHAHAWSDDYYFANNIFIVCFADMKFSLYICGWTHATKILSTEYTEIKLSFYLRIWQYGACLCSPKILLPQNNVSSFHYLPFSVSGSVFSCTSNAVVKPRFSSFVTIQGEMGKSENFLLQVRDGEKWNTIKTYIQLIHAVDWSSVGSFHCHKIKTKPTQKNYVYMHYTVLLLL